MKKVFLFLVCIFIVTSIFFISCESTKQEVVPTNNESEWKETELSDLENCGYFFTTTELGEFDMIEGEFKKTTGYEKSAYGFVFGYTADESGKLKNYIRFEINTDGEYALYSWDGKSYKDLIEANDASTAYFYADDSITKGYDSTNTLKIEINGNGKYDISINGTKVVSDIERIDNSTYGVMAFFSVGNENQEKLPDEPVKVAYRITSSIKHKDSKK